MPPESEYRLRANFSGLGFTSDPANPFLVLLEYMQLGKPPNCIFEAREPGQENWEQIDVDTLTERAEVYIESVGQRRKHRV